MISVHKEINKRIELTKRHVAFEQQIEDSALTQDSSEAYYKTTKEAKKLYNMARQVSNSIHRIESFTRLDIDEKGILSARIDPEHYVEDVIAEFFAERFPMYIIVLESRRGCFIKKKNQKIAIVHNRMESVICKLKKELDGCDILCDLLDFDEKSIWKVFYNASNIKERKNKAYFQRSITKKYQNLQGLTEEKIAFEGNESLLAYQGKENAADGILKHPEMHI